MNTINLYLLTILKCGTIFLLLILPIHTPLTTYLGSNLCCGDSLKAIKDILIFFLFSASLLLLFRDVNIRKQFFKRIYNKLIFIYGMLHVLLAAIQPLGAASVVGVTFNLRYLLVFCFVQVLFLGSVRYKKHEDTRSLIVKVVAYSFVLVAIFGALQIYVLPDNFLSLLGYGDETVRPFLTIDGTEEYVRINSSLRGPNPLGAYMMMGLIFFIGLWISKSRHPVKFCAYIPLLLAVLYGSYSRSAWLGLLVGLAIVAAAFFLTKGRHWGKQLFVLAIILFSAVSVLLVLGRDSELVRAYILHDSKSNTVARTSDVDRLQANGRALSAIAENPLGYGPGSAGPASTYGSKGEFYSENYFLQIAIEVGVLGLIAFVLIIGSVAKGLLQNGSDSLSLVAISILAGFIVINLVLHGWADDTTSITFWTLVGVAIGGTIQDRKPKDGV